MSGVALAQQEFEAVGAGFAVIFGLFYLAILVLMIAAFWKVFTKAGEPGWACLIPIYNLYKLLVIVGRPVWWLVLMLIPIVNFVILIIVYIDLAKSFGKDAGFAIGLIFLGFIFFPILGFGDSRYIGPAGPEGRPGWGGPGTGGYGGGGYPQQGGYQPPPGQQWGGQPQGNQWNAPPSGQPGGQQPGGQGGQWGQQPGGQSGQSYPPPPVG